MKTQVGRLEIITALFLVVPLVCYASIVFCDISTRKDIPQQLAVMSANPYTYLLGEITDGQVKPRPGTGELLTDVIIIPHGVPGIFSQHLVFCGNQAAKFRDKGTFVVLTYEKIQHRSYCLDLFSVHLVYQPDRNAGSTTP